MVFSLFLFCSKHSDPRSLPIRNDKNKNRRKNAIVLIVCAVGALGRRITKSKIHKQIGLNKIFIFREQKEKYFSKN